MTNSNSETVMPCGGIGILESYIYAPIKSQPWDTFWNQFLFLSEYFCGLYLWSIIKQLNFISKNLSTIYDIPVIRLSSISYTFPLPVQERKITGKKIDQQMTNRVIPLQWMELLFGNNNLVERIK